MFQHDKKFFSKREHLGLICNTDGVPIFKSSRKSLWPIYFQIANLPPPVRFQKDNIVIGGIWCGQTKPNMSVIFTPLLKDIRLWNVVGFDFESPEGHKTIRTKLLFGVYDLIAKAQVLNIMQFNGYYSCPTCLNPGEYHGVHVYPPGDFDIRTNVSFQKAIDEWKNSGVIVEGVKGVSPFFGHVDMIPIRLYALCFRGCSRLAFKVMDWIEVS